MSCTHWLNCISLALSSLRCTDDNCSLGLGSGSTSHRACSIVANSLARASTGDVIEDCLVRCSFVSTMSFSTRISASSTMLRSRTGKQLKFAPLLGS